MRRRKVIKRKKPGKYELTSLEIRVRDVSCIPDQKTTGKNARSMRAIRVKTRR